MNSFTKIIAGLSVAALASLSSQAPALASGNNDWDAIGYNQYLDGGDEMRFDIPLEGGNYVALYLETYDADADLCVVYPDGYTICSDDIGDDALTIDTEYGGNFDVYVQNVDGWGTDFTLYIDYA